jgi:dipeptidyl aminopeptidase/acylaminoacyl peptidase
LLVQAHPGPTADAKARLDLCIQFFTSRGFAVVEVNYAGSTGYGRGYRERLTGQWGVLDVADCLDAARFLTKAGEVDGRRLAISGESAGGFGLGDEPLEVVMSVRPATDNVIVFETYEGAAGQDEDDELARQAGSNPASP